MGKSWAEEISDITGREEYQTCKVTVTWVDGEPSEYDYATNTYSPAPTTTLYTGSARFIPVRRGTWQGGTAQLNATDIRAVQFQLAASSVDTVIPAGSIITINSAIFNPSLQGRTAKVTNDFQGGSTATRTIQASMDADTEDSDG